MNPTKLDHVAYWVADRDPVAEFVTTYLGMHVIDRTETFTLVGSNARRGKLTLFDADGPRVRGVPPRRARRAGAALAEPSRRSRRLGGRAHRCGKRPRRRGRQRR